MMKNDKLLYFPIQLSRGAQTWNLSSPTVLDITPASVGTYQCVAMVQDFGSYLNGLYVLATGTRWARAMPYRDLSACIFDSVTVHALVPLPGSTHLYLENSGVFAPTAVYRNGIKLARESYTSPGASVILKNPSRQNDVYAVIAPKVVVTTAELGDAPTDGKTYARRSATWSVIDNMTFREGTFGS